MNAFVNAVKDKDFTLYDPQGGQATDFSFLPILQYGMTVELRRMESFGQMLDKFYADRESAERVKQKGQDLVKSVTNARDRTARKLNNQRRELEATRDRERLREWGDIITSNLHTMEKGMGMLRAVNFYDPECREAEIPLDPLLTPQQNAAKYYKEYNKAKTAERVLTEQIARGEGELEYLNSVLENITLAEGERDLQEIRQELTDTGYLRRQNKAAKREKRVSGRPWSSAPPRGCGSRWGRTTPRTTSSPPSWRGRGTCGSTPRRSTAPTSSYGREDRPQTPRAWRRPLCWRPGSPRPGTGRRCRWTPRR